MKHKIFSALKSHIGNFFLILTVTICAKVVRAEDKPVNNILYAAYRRKQMIEKNIRKNVNYFYFEVQDLNMKKYIF